MDSGPPPDLEWCYEAVQGVSRTFALTVEALDEPMASQIGLGYLLCRVADTVEDAGHIPPDEQVSLLATYDAALDPDSPETMVDFRAAVDPWLPEPERSADWTVVARAPTVWTTFADQPMDVQAAIVPPVREMVDGMADFLSRHADTGGLRLSDYAELDRYCHYAAGTVGTLITNLLTRDGVSPDRTEALYDTAGSFARLLQLVNVAKDVHADFEEENNVYLPATWLAAEGVDQEHVLAERNRDSVARVVERTATRARSFLDDAQSYLETMPLSHGNTLAAWSVPYLLSVGTLRELENRPGDALTESGVKVDREEVFAVMAVASDTDHEKLGDLRSSIAREPYHLVVE
ncbi:MULTISPECIES: phytoene/squalene synthase family protein [unclassified Halorhabdus]|uniref:phytoene/squalene synthase family protein n=1 Tax=unclassified Halorhabdus TaxID=2621901 RepID=UPI0023DBF4DE|nr:MULTISPECIES: phytoene/squalene synthase family protein [unclassified Halorhabdus]WEL16871.1 Phytoene/squalene synthetase [Halorhabdus sp. SVX81]WEL20745.1 Phytoene/squalene synthetase [Halorhabdus sp. BNX81]